MFPVATQMGGLANAFPDVCRTPTPGGPVPVPYPNIAMCMQANPVTATKKVRILGQAVLVANTQIVITMGDEAGNLGGVSSQMFKGPAMPKTSSLKVKAEGQPVVYFTCMFGHNGISANAPLGLHNVPSQVKVMVAM